MAFNSFVLLFGNYPRYKLHLTTGHFIKKYTLFLFRIKTILVTVRLLCYINVFCLLNNLFEAFNMCVLPCDI